MERAHSAIKNRNNILRNNNAFVYIGMGSKTIKRMFESILETLSALVVAILKHLWLIRLMRIAGSSVSQKQI